MTFDNDKEFALRQRLTKRFGLGVYFAKLTLRGSAG